MACDVEFTTSKMPAVGRSSVGYAIKIKVNVHKSANPSSVLAGQLVLHLKSNLDDDQHPNQEVPERHRN